MIYSRCPHGVLKPSHWEDSRVCASCRDIEEFAHQQRDGWWVWAAAVGVGLALAGVGGVVIYFCYKILELVAR